MAVALKSQIAVFLAALQPEEAGLQICEAILATGGARVVKGSLQIRRDDFWSAVQSRTDAQGVTFSDLEKTCGARPLGATMASVNWGAGRHTKAFAMVLDPPRGSPPISSVTPSAMLSLLLEGLAGGQYMPWTQSQNGMYCTSCITSYNILIIMRPCMQELHGSLKGVTE